MTKNKITFPTIVFSLIIVIVTWSLIEGWLPFTRRKWLFLAIGMVFSFFVKNIFYKSKRFMWLCIYLVILLLNMVFGDKFFHDIGTVGYEFFCLGFPSVVATIILSNQNRKDEGVLLFSFLVVLVFTTVASFFIDTFLLPNAIRMMTRYSITLKDMSVVYAYYKMGLSTYSFPHALPVLIPPVVMGIKNKDLSKTMRLSCWITLISLVVLIYLSGIMTALLLSIAALIMAFITRAGGFRKNRRRFLVVGILFLPFISPSIVGSILHEAKMAVGEDSYYYNKLESFEKNVTGEDEEDGGDWEERQDLYSKSVVGFFENIIVGTNERVGGHSAFLDRLALLGLLGFIPFLLFILHQFKFSGNFLTAPSRIYYYEGLIMGLLMIALKSSFRVETLLVLFAILPIATKYLSYSNTQKNGL